jgi:hypothetical protein
MNTNHCNLLHVMSLTSCSSTMNLPRESTLTWPSITPTQSQVRIRATSTVEDEAGADFVSRARRRDLTQLLNVVGKIKGRLSAECELLCSGRTRAELAPVMIATLRGSMMLGVGNARERSEQGVTGPNNDAGPFALSSLRPLGPRNQPL